MILEWINNKYPSSIHFEENGIKCDYLLVNLNELFSEELKNGKGQELDNEEHYDLFQEKNHFKIFKMFQKLEILISHCATCIVFLAFDGVTPWSKIGRLSQETLKVFFFSSF